MRPFDIVQISRHPDRIHFQDLLDSVFQNPLELKGDRLSGDDPALWSGFATLEKKTLILLGQKKGRTPQEQKDLHYAMMSPSGYHKARRMAALAEKFKKPLISIIDTPGAYPGLEAEKALQSLAIAENLRFFSQLTIPTIALILGEGGSGGALGIGACQRVLMMEYSYYSVISPEGGASILWKDRKYAPQAAESLKITAPDALKLGIIQNIVPEPAGGAQTDWTTTQKNIRQFLIKNLDLLEKKKKKEVSSKKT